MNEDDFDLEDYEEFINLAKLRNRYRYGYLAKSKNNPLREDVKVEMADIELDDFLQRVEEKAYSRGYSDGSDDTAQNYESDMVEQDNHVRRLTKEMDKLDPNNLKRLEEENQLLNSELKKARLEKNKVLATISFELGQMLDTSPVPTDDVEAWAYQDGQNETIQKIMKLIEKMQEKPENEEGPVKKTKTFTKAYPIDNYDDDEWPPF